MKIEQKKRVVLIDASETEHPEAIAETIELIKACGLEFVDVWAQRIKSITSATYLGSGKVMEFATQLQALEIEEVIFQQSLSPLQAANLQSLFGIPVYDRSELIVEIFEQRAHTQEAKLQVRAAKLKKQRARLIGTSTSLGRQSGGKNKGKGEKQLELDRRILKQRISECEKQLKELEKHRSLQHAQRKKRSLYHVAIIGYTNAGKSTLLNALLEEQEDAGRQVLVKDQLFATLDTSLRRIDLPFAPAMICVDTVGFVSDLPHELIHAFHATLEEVQEADLLLHVVDASAQERFQQMEVTKQTLNLLHADHIPILLVYNKCDQTNEPFPDCHDDTIYISAREHLGLDLLRSQIAEILYGPLVKISLELPYTCPQYVTISSDMDIKQQENKEETTVFTGFIRKNRLTNYVNYVKF